MSIKPICILLWLQIWEKRERKDKIGRYPTKKWLEKRKSCLCFFWGIHEKTVLSKGWGGRKITRASAEIERSKPRFQWGIKSVFMGQHLPSWIVHAARPRTAYLHPRSHFFKNRGGVANFSFYLFWENITERMSILKSLNSYHAIKYL